MTKVKCFFVALCSVRESDFTGGAGERGTWVSDNILKWKSDEDKLEDNAENVFWFVPADLNTPGNDITMSFGL